MSSPDGAQTTIRRADTAHGGAAAAPREASLALVHPPADARVVGVDAAETIFGRDPAVAVPLPNDGAASRRHCRLLRAATGFDVEDLDSANGTFLNGSPLAARARVPLTSGDLLRVGDALLVYRPGPPPDPTSAAWDDPILPGLAPPVLAARAALRELASRHEPLLLVGDTGTGKEHAARGLHASGPRRARPFVALNCGAVSPNLVVSELFGSHRGAFSGAIDREGVVGQAGGGTLFLDELTELPLEHQPALLRWLQEGTYRPVGGRSERRSDARVIAATNRDLDAAVDGGHLREDLRARLVPVVLPPLRDRREDLLVWARRLGGETATWSAGFAEALLLHPWPRNLRELRQTLLLLALHDGPRGALQASDLPEPTRAARAAARRTTLGPRSLQRSEVAPQRPARLAPPTHLALPTHFAPVDRATWRTLVDALHRHRGVIARVAEELEVSRGWIYRRAEALDIDLASFRDHAP